MGRRPATSRPGPADGSAAGRGAGRRACRAKIPVELPVAWAEERRGSRPAGGGGIGGLGRVGQEDLGTVNDRRPARQQHPGFRQHGLVGLRTELLTAAAVPEPRYRPDCARKNVNHRWLNWSPISSPTSTGCDSSSSGGSTSGEITSPRLVNMVRYQGVRRRSPSDMPICTGREVSRKGGNLGGATVSARFATSDLHSGGSQPSGGRKLSSPSAVFSDAEGCSEGQAGSMLDITTLECRNRWPRSQMLSHIFTLAEGNSGSFPKRTLRPSDRAEGVMAPP